MLFTRTNRVSARLVAVVTAVSLLLSAFPASFFVALAASTGVTTNESELTTAVDTQVNFVASVTTDDGERTDGTFISVSDAGGGGSFFTGTTGGACNSTTPDGDNEFAIDANKGVCYSNSTAGEYEVTVQLLDAAGGNSIGESATVTITVEAEEESVLGCTDPEADNFDPEATEDDESCEFLPEEADEEIIVVTGDNFTLEDGGWLFNRDSTTVFEFNDDMASIGDGSLYVGPVSAVPADKFIGENFVQVPVEDVQSFAYDFKIAGNGTAGDANEFYLNVYTNIDESQNFYDCRFDYVPETGSTADFTTVTFSPDDIPVAVTKRGDRIANCPATLEEMPEGSFVYFFTINVGDTTDSDEGLAGYYDNVVFSTTDLVTTYDFEPVPEDPGLEITQPAADDETLAAVQTFTAEYIDADDIEDTVAWAIRDSADNACNGGTTFAGNVGGFDDDFTFDGRDFSTTLDLSAWENGEYCFVINPQESGDAEDFREVRTFTLENEPLECRVVITSDDTNTVAEKEDAFAQLLSSLPSAWTAMITDAAWIWGDDPAINQTETQTFEKSFNFSGPVTEATLYVAADNTFVANLNDKEIANIAITDTFRAANQQEFDVSSLIQQGQNDFDIAVTNLGGPAGLLYRLEVVGTGLTCGDLPPVDASLAITDPATDGETLAGEHSFVAEYVDNDEVVDDIAWAIRDSADNACNGGTTFAGNVGGFDDPSTFVGSTFTALVDMSEWEDGEYCFVVNPQEGEGEEDLRAVRNFTLENPAPLVCAPGVNLLANASFEEPEVTKNRGWDLFDSITGWISERVNGSGVAQVELQRGVNGWESSDGEQHTELGAKKAITLSQEIPTIAGESYTLSWDYSPRPGAKESENDVVISVDGEEVATNEGELPAGETEWSSHEYTFEGTGEVMKVAFSDDGIDNGKGAFLDNAALVCDPNPALPTAPYCGDGIVQTEGQNSWEQCEIGDEGCTDYCLFANQCSMEQLVKITLDETESASFDGMIYLGTAEEVIPNGTWFNFAEAGDAPFNTVANNVDGLAVERNQENGQLNFAFSGGNEKRSLDIVAGTIETLGITLGAVAETGIPSFRLEDSGVGIDVVEKDGDTVTFDLRADTGNDGVAVDINAGEKFNCPECLANVEARVVLQDVEGNFGNLGAGNLEQTVVLGNGETVKFGEWFNIFDGTEFAADPSMVESFANGEEGGIFVSRTGDGFVKLALYGDHEDDGNTNHEFIKGRLEFRDIEIVSDSLAGLAGQFKLEDHSETNAIDSDDGFDRIAVSGATAVEFDFWADTANDGFKVQVDQFTIDACEDDDETYIIEGFKWNDENGNGEWDEDEEGIEGWEIYLEGDDSFQTLMTDADGYYSQEVQAGNYVVYEEDRDGWLQTFPAPYEEDDRAWLPDMPLWPEFLTSGYAFGACQYEFGNRSDQIFFAAEAVLPNSSMNPEECNFGNQLLEYTIEGFKWNDENQNGEWDEDEEGIEGWEIYLESDDTIEVETTDEDGYYSFTVTSGEWVVSEEVREGWFQTAPYDNEDGTCELSIGQLSQGYELNDETIPCDFGNYQDLGVLACNVFDAQNSVVDPGGSTQLSWVTSGATSVTIDNEIGEVESSGTVVVTLPNEEDTSVTYTLTAMNGVDEVVTCETTISVEDIDRGGSSGGFSPAGIVAGASISTEDPEPEVAGVTTSNQCEMYLTEYMRADQVNNPVEVLKLQSFLNNQGFATIENGEFDVTTAEAVKAFQLMYKAEVLEPWFVIDPTYGLQPSGWVYKTTRWKINDIVCPDIEPFPTLP